jgi:hypothetical protein
MNEHSGFAGGLDSKVTGPYAPYFANYDIRSQMSILVS